MNFRLSFLWLSVMLVVAAGAAARSAGAQVGQPMPGGDMTMRSYHDEFPGMLYVSDSGWATVYPVAQSGETIDVQVADLSIAGLPDSIGIAAGLVLPVTVRRDYQQRGSTTPRLISTTWRYAPEVQFRRFQARLSIETGRAPDGNLAVIVDGKPLGAYSNRARYARVMELFWMERPFVDMRVTLDDRVLWEGRFVTVPGRQTRMLVSAQGVELVSP